MSNDTSMMPEVEQLDTLRPTPVLTQLSELRTMPYRDRIRFATTQQLEAHPELSTKPKMYIASKSKHRPAWRHFRDNLNFPIISRWIDTPDELIGSDTRTTHFDYAVLWKQCVDDVRSCDLFVLYVEPEEILKGALLELGGALMLNKEVWVCGNDEAIISNGSWSFHPTVTKWAGGFASLLEYLYGQEG